MAKDEQFGEQITAQWYRIICVLFWDTPVSKFISKLKIQL